MFECANVQEESRSSGFSAGGRQARDDHETAPQDCPWVRCCRRALAMMRFARARARARDRERECQGMSSVYPSKEKPRP